MITKKITLSFLTFYLLFFIFFPYKNITYGQNLINTDKNEFSYEASINNQKEQILEGRVSNILEEKQIMPENGVKPQLYQKLEIIITKGILKNKKIVIESGNLPLANITKYEVGDEVIINYYKDFKGKEMFFITDYVRRKELFWLFMIFLILTILVARWQGIASLIGMSISFIVIFKFILPKIYIGNDPVWTAILGSFIIIPATFFLSHGFNTKTLIAVLGTFISLIITGILASIFVETTKLTGFSSEEAGFLQVFKPNFFNIKGLLLAGIIIGVLGVLDDITISQSSIVNQLKEIDRSLKPEQLYKKAMIVGKDHIASMINTLVLVYTGASLPLLLIFIDNPKPFSQIINNEVIAEEIVRTLVGSIGLILAVPITTLIASFVFRK